jgi:DNA invertase Pin-like site-specific DNA recombinase
MAKRTRPGDPKVAIAYLRVSTAEQQLGPEAQRASIEAWAAREGVSVASWHVDTGVSGGCDLGDRPALGAALGELRAIGAGVLAVARRDRLARDSGIAIAIERATEQAGAKVVSADGSGNGDTPSDVFMRRILDAAAEHERSLIRARTRAALAAKARKGERVGGVPFGFRVAPDGLHLERDDREQATIATAKTLAAGGLSQRAIAAALAVRGILSRAGRPFAQPQICAMLAAAK